MERESTAEHGRRTRRRSTTSFSASRSGGVAKRRPRVVRMTPTSSSAAAPVKTLREILVGMLARDRTLAADSEDRVQCVVCFDRIKCIALDPCGHVETCAECTLALVKDDKVIECPICKEKVNKVAFARV